MRYIKFLLYFFCVILLSNNIVKSESSNGEYYTYIFLLIRKHQYYNKSLGILYGPQKAVLLDYSVKIKCKVPNVNVAPVFSPSVAGTQLSRFRKLA